MKKTNLFALLAVTLFTFISCENFLKGEDVKNEIVNVIEYNNAPSYPINVELFNDSDGKIKTPATGEVTKKVTDVFTVRFEPAANHTFIRWEADVKGLNAGEKIVDYIEFEDPESLETKVSFKKASSKVIVLRPVCPENLDVINFNLSDSEKEYPKDSSIVIKFNQPVAEDCINNISVKIPGIEEGKDYLSYFKAPELRNGNEIVINSDWDRTEGSNYIPVAANGNKTIIITIPKDKFYYIFDKGFEPIKVKLNNDLNYSYVVNSETSKQVNVKFFVDEDTKGILRVNEENANELSGKYSIGKKLNLRYKPNDGYIFDKWAVTRKYKDENGTDQTETIALDELNKINLQLTFPDNEDTLGYDSLSNVAQAVVTVDNYIDGTITISPVNKPRVGITFAVDDETQGTIKIGEKNLYNQDLQYSIGTAIQLKYKPAEGYIFSHWLFKAGNNEVIVNDASDAVLAALKSTFNLDFTCLEEGDITQASVTVGAYTGVAITVKPINKPRNKIQFKMIDNTEDFGVLRINDVVCDNQLHEYSLGKTVGLKFKVYEGYKFRGWTIAKVVLDAQGQESLEELSNDVYESYLDILVPEDSEDGYNETTRTASINIINKQFYNEKLVIYPDVTTIPLASVYFDGSNGKASLTTGTHLIKEGSSTSITYTPDSDYAFIRWQIINKNTGEELQNSNYIYFPSITDEITSFTIVSTPDENSNVSLLVKPLLAERPSVLSYTPLYSASGVNTDTTIKVMFDYDMDENSFYYDEQELAQLRAKLNIADDEDASSAEGSTDKLLKKADIDKYYGYQEAGKIYFKNIIIKNSNTDVNLLEYFNGPTFDNARTVSITVNKTNPVPDYTSLFVSIEKEAFYKKEGKVISMSGAKKWIYQVNNGKDDKPPVVLTTGDNYSYSFTDLADTDLSITTSAPTQGSIPTLHYIPEVEVGGEKQRALKLNIKLKDESEMSNTFTACFTRIFDENYNIIEEDNRNPVNMLIPYTGMMGQDAFFDNTISLKDLPEGVYNLRFIFNDQSNNTLTWPYDSYGTDSDGKPTGTPADYYLCIDDTAPEIAVPTISNTADRTLALNWAGSAVKDFKEVVIGYKESDSTDDYTSLTIAKGTDNKTLSLKGGTKYDFNFVFKDYAGNETEYNTDASIRPDKPTSVLVRARNNSNNDYGDTAVIITTTIPDTGHFDGIRIRYYPTGTSEANWSTVYVQSSESPIVEEISNLANGKTYEFEVAAYDAVNDNYSVVLMSTDKFYTKPAAPSFTTLPSNSSYTGQIIYTYTTPNSPFTKLWLYYSTESGSFSDSNRFVIDDSTQNHSAKFYATNLLPGTKYYFKLRASYSNDLNYSESGSDWCRTKTAPVASFSSSTVTNNSIKVTWTKPASGGCKGYILYYKKSTDSSYPTSANAININSANTLEYTISDLEPATTYNIKIRAKADNESVDSTSLTVQTNPAAVTNLAAVNGTSTSYSGKTKITLSWTNPSVYTYVKIYKASSESGLASATPTQLTKGTASYVDDNLNTGSTFYYKIRTYNGTDYWTDSEVISCSTSINAPTISSLSYVDSYTDRLKITWTNPESLGGIRIYKGSISDGNIITTITQTSSAYASNCAANATSSYTITGLSPNEYTKVYVEAYKVINGQEFTASAYKAAYTYAAPVTSLSATADTSTQITLNWTNPTDDSYWNYLYIYNATTYVTENSSITNKSTTSYTITDLTPGTTYTFRVRTRNNNGTTASTYPSVSVSTPPLAPRNLTIASSSTDYTATSATSASTVKLTWNPPSSGNVTGYKVYYKTRSTSSYSTSYYPVTTAESGSGTSATYSISFSLTAATEYDFKVVSYVSGISNFSGDTGSVATTSTLTYPTAATGLSVDYSTDTTIKISWTPPAGNCTYQRVYYKKDGGSWSSTSNLSATTRSYTLTGVTPGSKYYIYIWNYYSNTSYSNSCSSITTYTRPGTPTNVKVTASNGGTKVSWTAPSGGVSKYIVYYKKNSETNYSYKETTNNYYTFSNSDLANNVKYDFMLAAWRSDSEYFSEFANIVSFYTPPAGLTNGLIYQDDGMGRITVRFYHSSTTSVDIFFNDSYIEWKSYSGSGYETYTYNIENYSRGTSYSLRVAPYHGNNSTSGDTAAWTQRYPNETYGTSVYVNINTVGNLVVNGTECSYSKLNNVITSFYYINNTNGSLRDGAFCNNRYITLSPYSIGAYEVTQQLFTAVMGGHESTSTYSYYPVNNVSWYHAMAFCNKLSVLHGLTPYYVISGYSNSDWASITYSNVPTSETTSWSRPTYNTSADGYRLPTECQHEFAARGGSTYYSDWDYNYPGSNTKTDVAWVKSNSGGYMHTVGTKPANCLGLYDMSGNIKEWLTDYNNDPSSGSYTDPYCSYSSSTNQSSNPSTLKRKDSNVLLKGGYYGSDDNAWVDSNGDKWYPYKRDYSTGFRICRPKTY